MIEIAGTHFPLRFPDPVEGRQVVLLGAVPIGAIVCYGLSSFSWQLELPLKRGKLGKASSRQQAQAAIEHEVTDWLEAAMSAARPSQRARASA